MERIERIAALYPVIMRAMGRIRTIVHDGMDLTYNQYKMLLTIFDQGNCTLNTVARELQISMSSASEMVDRLVNQGFVCRSVDEGNRRQVSISVTAKGQGLIGELQRGIVDNYRVLLARMPEEEQERLVRAFEDIAAILGTSDNWQMTKTSDK